MAKLQDAFDATTRKMMACKKTSHEILNKKMASDPEGLVSRGMKLVKVTIKTYLQPKPIKKNRPEKTYPVCMVCYDLH